MKSSKEVKENKEQSETDVLVRNAKVEALLDVQTSFHMMINSALEITRSICAETGYPVDEVAINAVNSVVTAFDREVTSYLKSLDNSGEKK